MHEVLVNHLGSLSLPRKSVVRLTEGPDMTLNVYRGRKTTMQQQNQVSAQSHVNCSRSYLKQKSLQTDRWMLRGITFGDHFFKQYIKRWQKQKQIEVHPVTFINQGLVVQN